ncbi:unnamed protein product [Closterium sp. NIES-53]
MYLMTCTRPDLAYPLSILARYVAPGRHRPEHMAAAKRVLRYLCSTSGMGLVLGGRRPVVLTGHADASWADDQATQRSSQGYTFSLGSGSFSWWSTRSSFLLSSSCEAEIYAGAMAAQELRWLTYLLTDLGEQPRSPPVLYVDNKAMLALCREHRLEHRTKHIALRYFLARELQQRGQLRLAYVASEANTADIFTKALAPGDHQRFCTMLACFALLDWSCDLLLSPTLPMGGRVHKALTQDSIQCKRSWQLGGPTRLLDLAYRTAEELAFNLSVKMTLPKQGGDAHGSDAGKMQQAEGSQVADHGVLALTGGLVRVGDDDGEVTAGKVAGGHDPNGKREMSTDVAGSRGHGGVGVGDNSTDVFEAHNLRKEHQATRISSAPGAGSAGPSSEFGGKSPVRGPREFEALATLPSKKLVEEILRLNCELESKLGKMEGVVTDSMEGALKKLTDEVLRKIDNMSSAVSATTERAITTSGITHALNTLIALVSGSPPQRADTEEPHATETAEPGDTHKGKRVAASRADNQRGAKRQRGPAATAAVHNPSVQDMLKQKWGVGGRGAGQPASPCQTNERE